MTCLVSKRKRYNVRHFSAKATKVFLIIVLVFNEMVLVLENAD